MMVCQVMAQLLITILQGIKILMKNKLLIVLDLGCLKAWHAEYDDLSTNPRLQLIQDVNLISAHGRLSDKLTDGAGRFPGAVRSIPGLRASGERHNIQLEFDRRNIKQLAAWVEELVAREQPDVPIYFAAEREIHRQVLDRLSPATRARLDKVVPEDLTKINGQKLLRHFATP